MDCEERRFSAPIVECDDLLHDLRRVIASWDDDVLIEDAITELSSSEPSKIEGPSGDLQDQGLEAMAPLVTEGYLQELNHLNNWLLSDNENWKIGLSPSTQDPGNVLQADVDLYQPEPYQLQSHCDSLNSPSSFSAPSSNFNCLYKGKQNEVWSERGHVFQSFQFPVETHISRQVEGDQHEQEHSNSVSTCKICLAYYASDRVETPCGHVFCQSCLSRWLEDGAKPCPQCSTLLSMDANIARSYANTESNVESRNDYEFESAPKSLIYQQGYQPALVPSQNFDTVQHGIYGLDQAAQQEYRTVHLEVWQPESDRGAQQEYQPVHLEVWQPESHDQSDPFRGFLPNEGLAESRESVDAAVAIESEQQFSQKRGRQKVVDHNGVAMRFDGVEERFTAYYRPSYWTEDDSAVFLGEYPTFEEAKDAHNLVTLVHEGPHAQMDLAPFTVDKYAEELKRWKGKHHVDVVCELRLRGRGLLKDGSVNYKHVGRRRLKKNTGTTRTRYFSTVLNDPGQSSNARTCKPVRAFLQTFDTPEEAARYADQALVKQKGVDAWTNFPLSSYITSEDELPLTFLPLSNNFRENLAQKRARNY